MLTEHTHTHKCKTIKIVKQHSKKILGEICKTYLKTPSFCTEKFLHQNFGLLSPLNFNLTPIPSDPIGSFGKPCHTSPNRENPWHPRSYVSFSICLLQAIMVWEKLKICSVFWLEAKVIFLVTFRKHKKPEYAWNFSKSLPLRAHGQ